MFLRSTLIKLKEYSEYGFWLYKKLTTKELNNNHYEFFYTQYFNLNKDFYKNKKVLDIGCGPRGSLEWADNALERIGIDPLAEKYKKLQHSSHEMHYVNAYAEKMPFYNDYFDIVCSFNSLDHVDDLQAVCKEIKRVLKPGGLLLIIVDIHNTPTITEPQTTKWSIISDYFKTFEVLQLKKLKAIKRGKIYTNVRLNTAIAENEKSGILTAKLLYK